MAANEHIQRCKTLLNNLGEFDADYTHILANLSDLYQKCLSGIEQEKVSVKDGILTVIEKYPNVALACLNGQVAVVKELHKIASEETIDPTVTVSINLGSLEKALGLLENDD